MAILGLVVAIISYLFPNDGGTDRDEPSSPPGDAIVEDTNSRAPRSTVAVPGMLPNHFVGKWRGSGTVTVVYADGVTAKESLPITITISAPDIPGNKVGDFFFNSACVGDLILERSTRNLALLREDSSVTGPPCLPLGKVELTYRADGQLDYVHDVPKVSGRLARG
ncbi:hypothetical protein [Streptomyces sp. NPDC055287]